MPNLIESRNTREDKLSIGSISTATANQLLALHPDSRNIFSKRAINIFSKRAINTNQLP